MYKTLLSIVLISASISGVAGDKFKRGEYAWSPEKLSVSTEPPLLDALRASSGAPVFSIEEASVSAPDRLNAIRTWNRDNYPIKNGFTHTFAAPAQVEINLSAGSVESAGGKKSGPRIGQVMQTADGDVMWSATIEVQHSYRLRLHLSNLRLPKNAKLWVASEGDEVVGPFDLALADASGHLWTPSVAGPTIRLVAMLPESDPVARFDIVQVAEMFRLGPEGEPLRGPEEEGDLSCLKQSLCFDTDTFSKIADVEKGIGRMQWIIDSENVAVCTGGLIADQDTNTTIPYFLSANHCFETQDVASTLEVFWDYAADNCDGTKPDLGTLPRSNGATLKATGVPADYLLLELNAIPAGRYFLGYDLSEAAISPGATLHRVSNPGGDVQSYSQTRVSAPAGQQCEDENGGLIWTLDTHIWQDSVIGGTIGGSSGSPVLTPDGNIVGQLSGSCSTADTQCNPNDPTIDGKLISYWSEVAPFLDPSSSSGSSDLSLAALDAAAGSYAPGDGFNVSNRVDNVGNADSAAYRITFYASADTAITSGDYSLGFYDRAALAAGGSASFDSQVTLPAGIPAGNYYIGAVLTPSDSNASNNSRYDTGTITVTGGSSPGFKVNAGLNGAWFNASMDGQGFLFEVFPQSNRVFVAWFTFDATRPPGSYASTIGEPGHRWLTAIGPINGNTIQMSVNMTSGGVFASGTPPVTHNGTYGTITVTFKSCTEATVAYNLPGVGSGVIEIVRVAPDNVALCNSMSQ